MNTPSATRPIMSAANAIRIAVAATATPSGSCTRISSHSATRNLARSASALIRALIRHSAHQPATSTAAIAASASPQSLGRVMVTIVLSGRNSAATTATAISRDASPASPAGGPPPGAAARQAPCRPRRPR